jgi:hypothetical protein
MKLASVRTRTDVCRQHWTKHLDIMAAKKMRTQTLQYETKRKSEMGM